MVARRQGELGQAKQLFREVLTRCYELGYHYHVAAALEALGLIAAAQEQAHDAIQLFGAAERLRETLQMPMAPANRAEYDRAVAAGRAQLGEAAFAVVWLAGQSMTLEQMIAQPHAEA